MQARRSPASSAISPWISKDPAPLVRNHGQRERCHHVLGPSKKDLSRVEKVLVDGGYSGEKFAKAIKSLIEAEVDMAQRSELHSFAVMPKHWIIKRAYAWLEKCRRLWKN